MANENQLIIEVSAETTALVKSLATAENGLANFGKKGQTVAGDITTALGAIRKKLAESFDKQEIGQLNVATQELRGNLSDIKNIGLSTANAINQVTDATKKSRYAVLGLNQVVRDLPFGFIAISNNIPVLTDQLQELFRVNNNKLIPTLKSFGQSLVGAAGIGLAISAVTSIVTYAIKEYGSLGNAVRALFGEYTELDAKLKKATEAFEKFNKEARTASEVVASARAESGGDIQFYQTLAATVLDVNSSFAQQNSALKILQKSNKEFFGDINTVAEAQQKLNQRIFEFTKVAQSEASVNALKKEITGTDQLIFQNEELLRQQKERIAELEKLPKLVTGAGREIEVPELAQLRQDADATRATITALYQTWSSYNKNLETETNTLTKANQALLEILRKQAEEQKEKQVQQKLSEIAINREIKLLQESLRNIGLQSDEYAKVKLRIIELQGELKKLSETDPRIRAQIDIDTNIAKGELFKDLDEQLFQEYKKSLQKAQERINALQIIIDAKPVKIRDKKLEELNQSIEKSIGKAEVPFALKINEKELQKNRKLVQESLVDIGQIANGIAGLASDFLGNIFDDIAGGKTVIDSLANSFKNLTKQLAVAIVKFAIFKAIEAGLAASTGGTSKLATAGIGQFLQFAFGGGPSFLKNNGLSVGQGGLALAGQVTFVQRGPDLVGVLQMANNRINRVG